MPAKDTYHDEVKRALQKDGWTITNDPLYIRFLDQEMWIDLGVERLLAAEKYGEKIAVEIKSFLGSSPLSDFHEALGQFMNYRMALGQTEPDRLLYLAVPLDTYETFFLADFGEFALRSFHLRLIVYKASSEEIVTWIT